MKQHKFLINNHFMVDPALNTFADRRTGKETRLEPRYMNVLCLLVSGMNQLMTRETLIREVWNDYGGGDEGLNQAISFLRKLLGDTDKKIIETIPTKGYIFRAVISDAPVVLTHSNHRKMYWMGGVILTAVIISLVLLFWRTKEGNSMPPSTIKVNVHPHVIIKPERKLESRPPLPPRQEDSLSH